MVKVLVITGPTASGKSGLALELAEKFPLEIISADSMQVYRHMNIGTDKPSPKERELVPHHLIDIRNPDEAFSVEEFQKNCRTLIGEIWSRGRIPCVVGGTGLYIRALFQDYPLEDAPPNLPLRKELFELAKTRGNEYVHSQLQKIDSASFRALHPNDLKRVIRAIEYYMATGSPISERRSAERRRSYDSLFLGLFWPRQDLYERIDNRVENQFQRGFVKEVMGLLDMGYSPELASMQGLGYKEICFHLFGLLTLEETRNLIKRNTRRFAKRQFTWFAKEKAIIWVNMKEESHGEIYSLFESWFFHNGDDWRDRR